MLKTQAVEEELVGQASQGATQQALLAEMVGRALHFPSPALSSFTLAVAAVRLTSQPFRFHLRQGLAELAVVEIRDKIPEYRVPLVNQTLAAAEEAVGAQICRHFHRPETEVQVVQES